jgi:7,8-dihydropterin-6-yl-methyl-4-(beta-D-ribofuranosyl)aminobenzene 5'-phosphate synthase
MAALIELDSLEIHVIVDNELDPISPSPNEAVQQSGGLKDIGIYGAPMTDSRGGAKRELRMDAICCSAHGLSLMVTGIKREQRHTLLFDTGPEEDVWERNATRLKADIGAIELVHLSHYHRDHSGGMLRALKMINKAKKDQNEVVVDLHPDRPDYRGIMAMEPISLEADPTFDEIAQAGGKVVKNAEAHTVLDNFFLVSGEIPRVTPYELGLKRGIRFDRKKGAWEEDTLVKDERYVMCKLKGRLP